MITPTRKDFNFNITPKTKLNYDDQVSIIQAPPTITSTSSSLQNIDEVTLGIRPISIISSSNIDDNQIKTTTKQISQPITFDAFHWSSAFSNNGNNNGDDGKWTPRLRQNQSYVPNQQWNHRQSFGKQRQTPSRNFFNNNCK